MTALRSLLTLFLVLLCLPPAARADELSSRVDALFAAWDKPDTPGASLAVVRDGKIVYSRGYGLAHLEYGVRNTPATVFHVASLSKQFTAFAIQLLLQDGKLALDDEVRKVLPELQLPGPPITIRQLIHHTSGLRDQWSLLSLAGLRLDDGITEADILGLLWQQRQLNFAPGEEHLYSNSGYTLLGLIVKRVSGQSLAAFAQARIFGPLGMKHSHFQEDYGVTVPGRAYSYQRGRNGYRYVALSYSNVGATSLFTTVEDLARWDANFDSAQVGGPVVQAAMLQRGRLNNGREIGYASGLMLGRHAGLAVVEHSGSDAGYRTHLLRIPERHLSVLLLANAGDLNAGTLSRRVADLYLGPVATAAPPKVYPPEVVLEARDLAPFLGDFEMRPGFVLSFTREGTQLMVQATGQPKFAMFASAPDRFFMKVVDASVVFDVPAGAGAAATAIWTQNGSDLPLHRLSAEPLDAEALQACAGEYYSEELHTLYRLSWRDGRLQLRYPRGELPLKPMTRDFFSAGYPLGTVMLKRNASQACDGLAITTGRVRNLLFKRVLLTPF